MAKTWIKAKSAFNRQIGNSTVVGHPDHPHANGRFAEVEDGHAVDDLVNDGHAERISEEAYRKGISAGTLPDAGEVRQAQLSGDAIKVNPTMSNAFLRQEADKRGVDISGAKDRAAVVKLINAGKPDESGATDEGLDNANSRLSGLTADTTSHPHTSTPQKADPTNRVALDGELGDADDAAPTDGDDGKGGEPTPDA